MGVYELKSNQQFLRYFDEDIVYVSELNAEAMNSSAVKRADWTKLTKVGTDMPYDALDVNGALISGSMLEKLAQDLGNSRWTVNCEGLCFLKTATVIDSSFNVEYYRLNDLLSWSAYGVQQAIETTWNRCDIKKGDVLVDLVAMEKETKELRKSVREKEDKLIEMEAEGERLRKQLASGQEEVEKKEEELKKAEEESKALRQQVAVTEAELKSKKEEFAKKEKELKKVEAAYKVLQLQLSATEAELQSVKDELEEKKRELKRLEQIRSVEKNLLEEEINKKEKELEKAEEQSKALRKQLGSTEAELSIKKEELETKEKELKKVQEKSNEMVQKLAFSETELRLRKAQLEKLKEESNTKEQDSDSLLQQLASAKAELKFAKEGINLKEEVLEKVKQEAKTFREKSFNAEAELKGKMQELEKKGKELENQLSSSQVEQEKKDKHLKEVENELGSLKNEVAALREVARMVGKEMDQYMAIVLQNRLPLAPERLSENNSGQSTAKAYIFPKPGEIPRVFTPVIDGKLRNDVRTAGKHVSDGEFDSNNWWLTEVKGDKDWPHTGSFLISYYGGTFDIGEAYGMPVNIPFHRGATFRSSFAYQVAMVRGIGLRFLIWYNRAD